MLQNTRTMPACRKVTLFEVCGGYRPMSNGWPLKFENALWKIRSRFGSSTVLPREIANTCGWNSLSFCSISTRLGGTAGTGRSTRSEEHTSELQSLRHLVCRLLLEKKKKRNPPT